MTMTASDDFVFRVPSLRNIVLTAPYLHTGKAWGLRLAIASMGSSQLGVTTSEGEVSKIECFLGALTGDQPMVTLPMLRSRMTTTRCPGRKLQEKR
ncbi:hypothetical protein [Oleiagrimonas sp.]|uniref:hypothetical protein n=1 Tax=Oleiagrimonas sp. TaxID=2010330 RepID=UPI002616F174|nr:hypothetical protein [Oleiagrimonas sp.]MDA3913793.1 hypothetical protein [Oleiagrimonas sp.]